MKPGSCAAIAALLLLSACTSTQTRAPVAASGERIVEPRDVVAVSAAAPAAAAIADATPAPIAAPLPSPALPTPKPKPKPAPAAVTAPAKPVAKPIAKPAPAVATGVIKGRMELLPGARQKIAAGEVSDGLVYFLPQSGGAKPKPGRYTINTHSKGFSPNLLVVPAGSTVAFPNKDSILHNVYSRTPGSLFDLKTYGPGESRQTVLSKAGLVIVNCNVHHSMRANIVVLATPYYARPGKDGGFQLDNLPPGPGTLVFWHPRSSAQTQALTPGATAAVVKKLTASKPRLDDHMTTR